MGLGHCLLIPYHLGQESDPTVTTEPGMSVQFREVSGEENLAETFRRSLSQSMVSHYGTFAALTAIRLVFRLTHGDGKDGPAKSARLLIDSWRREVERSLYPEYVRRKDMILSNHPTLFKETDLDAVFQKALDETAETLYRSLLEESPTDSSGTP